MLNLNLISQADKDVFRYLRYQRAAIYLGGIAGVVIAVFAVLLLPSFLFLNFQRKEILRSLQVEEETVRTFGVDAIERNIRAANARAALVVEDERLAGNRASEFLEAFSSVAVSVKITRMQLDFDGRRIAVDGIAPTRNSLLAFQRSLEERGLASGISAPLSNLVKLTDVVFNLKGTLP